MMKPKSIKEKILENPAVKKEYEKSALQFNIAEMVMRARIKRGMTQKQLAKRVGTKQPSVARVESGNYVPSLNLLNKIAKALGTELILPEFASLETDKNDSYTTKTDFVFENKGQFSMSASFFNSRSDAPANVGD